MKIDAIKSIKRYKSFIDYSWLTFLNNNKFADKINIVYGENGSGKTSVCDILKAISQCGSFENDDTPKEVCINFDGEEYKFANYSWNKKIDKGQILFFDRRFVDTNVHLGNTRGTQQGEQEQSSGKLLIEFDSDAITLHGARERLRNICNEKSREIEGFKKLNRTAIDFFLNESDAQLFEKFKGTSNEELAKTKDVLREEIAKTTEQLKLDQSNLEKTSKILEDIGSFIEKHPDDDYNKSVSISGQNAYQSLFDFDLTGQAKIEADIELVKKIRENKDFFTLGLQIKEACPDLCPFCQSDNVKQNVQKITEVYQKIYDDSFKKKQLLFESGKRKLIEELDEILGNENFDIASILANIIKIREKYKISNLNLDETENLNNKPGFVKLKALREKIWGLEKPTKENISAIYISAKDEIEKLRSYFSQVHAFVKERKEKLSAFQRDNTNIEISKRISRSNQLLISARLQLSFLDSDKLQKQKLKEEKLKAIQLMSKELEKHKTELSEANGKYEQYCSSELFTKTLSLIQKNLKKFSIDLRLNKDTRRSNTREYPFAFKVVDRNGKCRDFDKGLSDGEKQVLSICFFLAFLEIQNEKDKKIIIFDDPITSLDNANLGYLVECIGELLLDFSQVFIFTHHLTFFKFLRKRFNPPNKRNPLYEEFNLVKNKTDFGGSFIFKSCERKFINDLRGLEETIRQRAQNPNGFDQAALVIEYGQYLRYEVEGFIKNTLLQWNLADTGFKDAVKGLKKARNVTDSDFDEIEKIHSFCNWTTAHVNIGEDHGLAQLRDNVSRFIGVIDRYNQTI